MKLLIRGDARVDSPSKIRGSIVLLIFILIFIVWVIVPGGQDRHEAVDDFYGESFTKTGQEGDGIRYLGARHFDRRSLNRNQSNVIHEDDKPAENGAYDRLADVPQLEVRIEVFGRDVTVNTVEADGDSTERSKPGSLGVEADQARP